MLLDLARSTPKTSKPSNLPQHDREGQDPKTDELSRKILTPAIGHWLRINFATILRNESLVR
jgi:hypothetical protein